jgi:hypothetical protein
MTSVVLTTLANAVHCSAQPASAVIPHCSKFLVEVALVERLAFSGRNILWLVESMQEFERFSLWLVDKVRCAGLHSRRELAPGHHGWLLPSAVALVLPHTYPSSSHRKRTLNFWSRLSSQLRQRNASTLTVLRLEASMNWLSLVTLGSRSQRIVAASCFVPKGQRDQGCKGSCQLPHIVRQAQSWHLYCGCAAQLP